MPDPCSYSDRSDFISACVSERQGEHPDEGADQSVAVCSSMWGSRECGKSIHKAGEIEQAGDREAVFVASSSSVDRAGDVVEQNWEFRSFWRNPILLFQHEQRALPVGKVTRLWTDDSGRKTYARAEAPPEGMDEFADRVWRFIKNGFLNAVSVGFLPLEDPAPIKDKSGNWTGYRYPRNSLLELSVVSVPANPEAVVVARSMGMTDDSIAKIFQHPKSVPAGDAWIVRAAKRRAEIARLRVRN